jgi:hypothetical protein
MTILTPGESVSVDETLCIFGKDKSYGIMVPYTPLLVLMRTVLQGKLFQDAYSFAKHLLLPPQNAIIRKMDTMQDTRKCRVSQLT